MIQEWRTVSVFADGSQEYLGRCGKCSNSPLHKESCNRYLPTRHSRPSLENQSYPGVCRQEKRSRRRPAQRCTDFVSDRPSYRPALQTFCCACPATVSRPERSSVIPFDPWLRTTVWSSPPVAARLQKNARSGTWGPFANAVAWNVGKHEISGLYPNRPFGPDKPDR